MPKVRVSASRRSILRSDGWKRGLPVRQVSAALRGSRVEGAVRVVHRQHQQLPARGFRDDVFGRQPGPRLGVEVPAVRDPVGEGRVDQALDRGLAGAYVHPRVEGVTQERDRGRHRMPPEIQGHPEARHAAYTWRPERVFLSAVRAGLLPERIVGRRPGARDELRHQIGGFPLRVVRDAVCRYGAGQGRQSATTRTR